MSRNADEIDTKNYETYRIGDFTFSVISHELQDVEGNSVPLRAQSGGVLAELVRASGEVVTKEHLLETVWQDTFVTDDSLVQCVADIRRALNDGDRKLVQTVPKKGYKLIAEPVSVEVNSDASPKSGRRGSLTLLIGALAVIVLIAGWVQFKDPVATAHKGDKPKIAVLPFDDFSTGEDKGYLSDAIAEGIITELARFPLFSVIARNSSFKYRDEATDIRQIGEDLGVHYLLEGSKQKSGDQLKVTVQLIDAATGEHLWAHTYDQRIGDLFTVQDQIIKTVANRIGVKLERPAPGYDDDRVTALHLHLKGVEIIRKDFNAEAMEKIIDLNNQAVEVDPDAPYGYIGLAHTYRAVATFGWLGLSHEEALELGFAASDKALELAPGNPEVHYSRARLFSEANDREAAMASFATAIQLNPSASNYLVASTSPMLYAGQKEEAIARLEQAMGIDPFHEDWYHWQMGWALWEVEDCDGALASMQKMKKIRRGAHRMLAGIYACLGEVEKAQEAYQVFYAEADEPTVSEQREEWKDIWTAPGSLDRWLEHMKIAGMKDDT